MAEKESTFTVFVAFAAVVVPGLAFVGAFSIACPAVMPVPLYQFLFVGYWFWGNALAPDAGIPTLSETVLTPIGLFRAIGFFGPAAFYGPHSPEYNLGAAIASTVLMFGVAALPLLGLWGLERWRRGRG